jgi:hypothetical protein
MVLFRSRRMPPELAAVLDREDQVLAMAATAAGPRLAVSRFGLWLLPVDPDAGPPERWPWHTISRARLQQRMLRVVRADVDPAGPDGIMVLHDRPEQQFELVTASGLSDVVHTRVRRSVAASGRASFGGWVVLRRIAGQDGLTVQYRPEPGALLPAGWAGEVLAIAAALRERSD